MRSVEAMEIAVQEGDDNLIAALLLEYPEVFRLNVQRGAVQIYDCQGRTVGNLPIRQSFGLLLASRAL